MVNSQYFIWNISPEIIKISIFSLRWYGLLFALCFVIGYRIMQWIFISENRKANEVEELTFPMVLGTVVGARLGHCLFYDASYYLSNPLQILKVWEGGLASHGAALGILFALYLYVRKNKDINYIWILDRIVIVVALSGFMIRLGNFFNSEILGKPSTLPWAIIFQRHDLIPRHPSQLYEGFISLIVFIILFLYYKKYKTNIKPGFMFSFFVIVIFTSRFFIEFLKENQVNFENDLPIDMGQILSIPLVLLGLYIMFLWKPKKVIS